MRLSWKLGRIEGIDVYLHPSALLVFLFASGSMDSGLATAALVIGLFGSILLHELGHALMARRYGIGTADITLYVFGGVARLLRMPRSAGPEMLIALAGPAVNFAIASMLAVVAFLVPVDEAASLFLWQLLSLNLALALFNLLPIFPMDGGRVLRAMLSGWLGRLRATEVAATVGRSVAVVGGIWFLANGMWLQALLALFVYAAAGMELAQVRAEGGARGGPGGFVDGPAPPMGFRWASRGDGVWRLVPIFVPAGRDRSWN